MNDTQREVMRLLRYTTWDECVSGMVEANMAGGLDRVLQDARKWRIFYHMLTVPEDNQGGEESP